MASTLPCSSSVFIFVAIFSLLVNLSLCFNISKTDILDGFSSALGTWYGEESGSGSGGACGWADDVSRPPYYGFISAGNDRVFLGGKGCGNCYQVLCNRPPFCSGKPITVTVSDQCPGKCNDVPYHFDLSGTAFGAMANPGQAHNLRMLGQVDIQFQRVPCYYRGANIAFRVDAKVNPYYFAAAIENINGDGALQYVAIASAGSSNFKPMQNVWGAEWRADIDPSFKPPFSIKLTSPNGKTVWATNVIPANFAGGALYRSNVNF